MKVKLPVTKNEIVEIDEPVIRALLEAFINFEGSFRDEPLEEEWPDVMYEDIDEFLEKIKVKEEKGQKE